MTKSSGSGGEVGVRTAPLPEVASIVASATDAIISVDESQRIVLFNAAAEEVFGCPAGEALGSLLGRFIPERYRAAHVSHIREFGATGVSSRSMQRPGVLSGLRASGEEFPIEATISQAETEAGRLYTVILRDITERRRAEAALDREQALAAAGNRARAAFMAVLSHELRTPLNAIMGYADLMASGAPGPLTAAQASAVDRISVSSRHLLGLIEHVLMFSSSGRLTPRVLPEPVRPGDLLQEATEMLEPLVRQKGLRYDVEVQAGDREFITDPSMLRQIVVNLVGNAIKFTDAGSVGLTAALAGVDLRLQVRDTGPGIAEENLPLIWEPFWRDDQALTRRQPGAGLGLSVTRSLVEALGGTITVESQAGTGTVFTVVLPPWQSGEADPGE